MSCCIADPVADLRAGFLPIREEKSLIEVILGSFQSLHFVGWISDQT
jgi:hypothetical protein